MNQSHATERAALAAAEILPHTGVIGLGSGRAAARFIEKVGLSISDGRRLVGVPTSEQSRTLAERLNIPLLDDAGPWEIDLCVDGADEVSDDLDLIKGGGGCHLREKIVNQCSRFNVIIVDESKLSHKLGERKMVPVEVMQFGHQATGKHLQRFGAVALRQNNGTPYLTDAGNFIYDLSTGPIANPAALEVELHGIAGVIEIGLFVARADIVIVGSDSGVRRLMRQP
jgi:ribose 5-phosphate isomerase A